MSKLKPPLPVKPFVSLLCSRPEYEAAVWEALTRPFGPPDLISGWLPFTQTEYYTPEMGPELQRRLAVFLHLMDPAALVTWKKVAQELEARLSLGGRRLINLDPGYLTRERLVLATGKNYTHRLYLGQGIYSEVTLIYQKGDWQSLPWTYPDYRTGPVQEFLTQARRKYLWQLRQLAALTRPAARQPLAPAGEGRWPQT